MARNNDTYTTKYKQYFGKIFSEDLQKWKKQTGKTQEDFAEEIGISNPASISNYKNGKSLPEAETIERICAALGVPADHFEPHDYDLDQRRLDRLAERHIKYAEEIGLDIDFVKAVVKVDSFEERFPYWRPIVRNPDQTPFDVNYKEQYIRAPKERLADSAPMSEENSFFQIKVSDDRLITISTPDLEYLLDVQEKVREYIGFLFYQREHEREEEVKRANTDSYSESNGCISYRAIDPMKYDKYLERALLRSEEREEK